MRSRTVVLAISISLAAACGGFALSATPALTAYTFEKELESATISEHGPVGLAVNQTSGKVYLSDIANDVDVFEGSGAAATPAHLTAAAFTTPFGAAVDNSSEPSSTGALYIADLGSGEIEKFNAAGAEEPFVTGLNQPWGIAVDSKGNVYVGSLAEGTISRYSSSGVADPGNPIISGVSEPKALAFDAAGNLYAATGEGTFEYEASTGFTERKLIDEEGHTGVAVITAGPSSGDVITDEGGAIARYTPSELGIWTLVEKFGEAQLNAGEGAGGYGVGINNQTQAVYAVDRPPNGEPDKAYLFHYTVPVPPVPPSVQTEPASGATLTAVTLSGTVNPGGAETKYYFEYGTAPCGATSCGTKTEEAGPLNGRSPLAVKLRIGQLTPNTAYSYWIAATSSQGTVHGLQQEFTTETQSSKTKTESSGPGASQESLVPVVDTSTQAFPVFPNLAGIAPVPAPKSVTTTNHKTAAQLRAERLRKALRACGAKPKHARVACEKRARAKYGPKK